MPESMVPVGDAELCVDTFGRESDPAVLLIERRHLLDGLVGAGVLRADRGRRPVRDPLRPPRHRPVHDQSPVGEPSYTGADLSADPLRILDALGIASAHLVGVSMGGGIAQDIAVAASRPGAQPDPDRDHASAFDRADPTPLPPPEPRIMATFEQDETTSTGTTATPWWTRWSRCTRSYAGSLGVDEDRVRAISQPVVERTHDVRASVTNHWIVVGGGEGDPAHDGRGARSRRWCCTARTTRCSRWPTARRSLPRSAARGSSRSRAWATRCRRSALWDVVVPAIVEHTAR